jgi:hypothetical protein
VTDAIATETRGVFSLLGRVDVDVRARPERLWALLTDAKGFPRWNSTVSAIDGEIREGNRLRVRVPGTSRVFTPTVSGVVTNQRMIWTGGVAPLFKGVRTFELRPKGEGVTAFTMTEVFSGLMLPIVGRALPDFRPIFARYAHDLKAEAER